jgi:putative exosortase-associated protein (TIGR04073 family)
MKLPRWTIVPVLALSVTAAAGSAWGAEATAERISLKAARGVDNTLLGLIGDWRKTVYYQSRDNGPPYGMTVGVVQGLAVGLARTGVGLYELATFPVPVPTGYRPILSPVLPRAARDSDRGIGGSSAAPVGLAPAVTPIGAIRLGCRFSRTLDAGRHVAQDA